MRLCCHRCLHIAFVLQVIEKLYRLKWGPLDGLGVLVISPTRELALQIFDELRKIGKKHELSAGLLIGGKKVKEEQERVQGASPPAALLHVTHTFNLLTFLLLTVFSQYNNCIGHQRNCPYIELSLLRGATVARMQCLIPSCIVLTSRMS